MTNQLMISLTETLAAFLENEDLRGEAKEAAQDLNRHLHSFDPALDSQEARMITSALDLAYTILN